MSVRYGSGTVACESLNPPQGRRGFAEQIFGADEQVPKGGCGPCPKNDPPRVIDDGCKQEPFGPT